MRDHTHTHTPEVKVKAYNSDLSKRLLPKRIAKSDASTSSSSSLSNYITTYPKINVKNELFNRTKQA